jgi:hypothetical protein
LGLDQRVGTLYADELDHVATNLDRLHGSATNQATGPT